VADGLCVGPALTGIGRRPSRPVGTLPNVAHGGNQIQTTNGQFSVRWRDALRSPPLVWRDALRSRPLVWRDALRSRPLLLGACYSAHGHDGAWPSRSLENMHA